MSMTAAYNLLCRNFKLTGGDSLLFIYAPGKEQFDRDLRRACAEHGINYESRALVEQDDYELPGDVIRTLQEATAALISTKRSYTHTDGVRGAAAGGVRIATNSALSEAQLIEGLLANYDDIARLAQGYAARLQAAKEVRLGSGDGALLSFRIEQQVGLKETGLYTEPGMVGNLPAGEAACGIDDLTGEGELIVDGSWPGLGVLESPLRLIFEKGAIVHVAGERAPELQAILKRHGPRSRQLAELGLGMHPGIDLQGITLLDEKIAGTVHVAVGNDVSFGGSNNVGYHADGVVLRPRLWLDGEEVELPTKG